MPLQTDTIIAEAIVSMAVSRLPGDIQVDVLPAEPVGYSVEHSWAEGTDTLGYEEAIERWIGIAADQKKSGVSKFVMLNAHGGNSPLMTIIATELRVRHEMLAVATSWPRFGYPDAVVNDRERAIGIHAGFVETSIMLALRPDLVDMGKAEDFASRQTEYSEEFKHLRAYGSHAFGWAMNDLNDAGAVGNASAANAEAGMSILEHAAVGFAELLADVHRFDVSQLRN